MIHCFEFCLNFALKFNLRRYDKGNELQGEASGFLAFKKPWPSAARSCFNNQQRFEAGRCRLTLSNQTHAQSGWN